MRRLPPLNALRVFEAAARHGSFVAAAEELAVTPAAVSQQVRALEERIGVVLFRRMPSGLLLTEEGRAFVPGLTEGFDRLARAAREIEGRHLRGRVMVSCLSAFAVGWLVPRLGDFRAVHPNVDLVVHTSRRYVDFAREGIDVAVRFGRGPFTNHDAVPLMREEVFPVCSPALLATAAPFSVPADLEQVPLLDDVDVTDRYPVMSWRDWLVEGGVDPERCRFVGFTDSIVIVAAALAGQGVALGRRALLGDHLETGRLVRPLPWQRTSDWSYHLVAPRGRMDRPEVRAFVDWCLARAATAGGTERSLEG